MPLFFFDVDDGKHQIRDEIGKSLISPALIALEVDALLLTLADLMQIEGRPGTTRVSVRDENGRQVYEGTNDVQV